MPGDHGERKQMKKRDDTVAGLKDKGIRIEERARQGKEERGGRE